MGRAIAIALLTVVLGGVSESATVPSGLVQVGVYNDAGVGDEELQRAQEIATRIYARAGVALAWSRCGKHGAVSGARRGCSYPGLLSIRVVSNSMSLREEDFGVAFLGSDGTGAQADVFYSGIEKLRQRSTLAAATILGNVMAHELGHLLLGINAHARTGIMQARWADRELREMGMGNLVFNERQSEAIRARILGASEMAAWRPAGRASLDSSLQP